MVESIFVNLSSQQPHDNLRVLTVNSFFRGTHNSVFNVILQPFALSLGASMTTVGLLNSLGGMNGIFTTLAQSLGGWLADRIGRKPFLVVASLLGVLAYVLLTIAGALQVWLFVLGGIILFGMSFLSRPAIAAITAESAPAGQHGSAFSVTMVAWIVPGVVAPALSGWVTDQVGYGGIFPIMLAFEVASLLLVGRWLRETHASREPIRWRDFAHALMRSLLPPRGLRAFFIACAGDSFAWALGWGLLNGMLVKTYGFMIEQLGIMASIMSLAWAIMQMPIGRYVDRHGLKGIMIFSESMAIPLMLVGITQRSFEMFAAAQVLFALTAATWVPVVNTFLTRAVPAASRSEAFGRLNMFRGLIAFPASWLGGLLFDWGGIRAPLTANLIGSCVVIVILILFVSEPLRIMSQHVHPTQVQV